MSSPELIAYIREQFGLGRSVATIRSTLLASGWSEELIQEGLTSVTDSHTAHVQRLSATELWSASWQMYKNRWQTFILFMLISNGLQFLWGLGASFGVLYLSNNLTLLQQLAWPLVGTTLVIAIFMIVIYFWSYTALLVAIRDTDESIGVTEAYRRAWPLVWSYWWVSFLYGITIGVGFILLVFPAFLFALWFGFATYVLVDEEKRGWEAMNRSRDIAQGNLIAIFGRSCFLIGGLGLVAAVILVPLYLVASFIPDTPSLVVNFPQMLLQIAITPFAIAYAFLLYRNLRDLKGSKATH